MGEVIYVLGLQGVGKSTYIDHIYPGAAVIDYEAAWDAVEALYPGMDKYEVPTYIKVMAAWELTKLVERGEELVVVECTGMSRVGQAAIKAMMDVAEYYGYTNHVVYLKPDTYSAYVDSITSDEDAMSMWLDFSRPRNPRWREPDDCPYFQDVEVVLIDHSVPGDRLELRHEEEAERRAAQNGTL